MNHLFAEITQLFITAIIENFERVWFANLFKEFNLYLEVAKIQGFTWEKVNYKFGKGKNKVTIEMAFTKNNYLILAFRYKELFNSICGGVDASADIPFEIEGYLTEIDTEKIDADYINSRFDKFIKNSTKENIYAFELKTH